jgi:phage terminase small subunit
MQLKNIKHEKFAVSVAAGASQAESYRMAGYKAGSNAAPDASALAKKPIVSQRIAELRADTSEKCEINREKYAKRLADCFSGKVTLRIDQLKAGEMLAKACGWNEAEKLDVTQQTDIIIRIGGIDI